MWHMFEYIGAVTTIPATYRTRDTNILMKPHHQFFCAGVRRWVTELGAVGISASSTGKQIVWFCRYCDKSTFRSPNVSDG